MINQNLGWRLIGAMLTVLLLTGCSASPEPPDKHLFIGTGITDWNNGTEEEAAFLRRIAWEAVQEYQGQQ